MLPKLEKLIEKCRAIGVEPVASGKSISKEDCVTILRAKSMPAGGLPYTELNPMLCFAEWNLKPEELKKVWTSPTWVAQRKLNGCRVIVHFVKDVGIFAHSRTVSVQTWRFQNLEQQFLWSKIVPTFSATIDTEAVINKPIDTRNFTAKGEITKTTLHSTTAALHLEAENSIKLQKSQDAALVCQVFDVTSVEGIDLRNKNLFERLEFLKQVQSMISASPELAPYFEFPEIRRTEKKEFFEAIVASGGEGIILKNLNSKYTDSSSRKRDAWVKVKKRIEFDAFVTGFIRGDQDTEWRNLVGALEFSINTDEGQHPIAMCTNLTMEMRRAATIYDAVTDTVSLNPEWKNRVAEVTGQDVSSRSLRLSHATIERFRDEGADQKLAEACFVPMADLKSAAEWAN